MPEPNAHEVYATLGAMAGLVGVSEKRIAKWVNHGQLVVISALIGGPRPRHRILYCLGDVQALAAAERRTYTHPDGVRTG